MAESSDIIKLKKQMKTASNQLLVIFGASGDLTGRKLLPSLYELHVRGLLPERFCILGAARTEYTDCLLYTSRVRRYDSAMTNSSL